LILRRLRLKITLRRGTRKKLAFTSSRETMARTKESLRLSMPNQQLPSRRRRKTKQSCLASLVESLVILLKSVQSEWTEKNKKKNVNLVTASSADDGYGNFGHFAK
jgi:hypothetical protein